jgi:sec-independent protein translocase protein TatC
MSTGQMPLVQHFQELRSRLFRIALSIGALSLVGWFQYDRVINLLAKPICNLDSSLKTRAGHCGVLYINGVLGPIDLKFKVSLLIGLVLASPIWIYQIWAFVAPALSKREKFRSLLFAGFAIPFFSLGIFIGYLVFPVAVKGLLGFTPSPISNLVRFDDYLGFVSKILIVFGFAFELPIFLLALNLIGVLKGRSILKPWRYSIFGILLFSAIFTPSGDPFTMLFLALPLIFLYFAAGFISLLIDARRKSNISID